MPRAKYRVIRANGSIIYETKVTNRGSFTYPEAMRSLLSPGELIRITIEKPEKQGAH
jgi:hypothetical protein